MTILVLAAIAFAAYLFVLWATHSYTITWAEGSQSISIQSTYTGTTEKNYDNAVPTATTNLLADITITVANLQSFLMVSDQVVTIKTNSTGTPQDTFTLAANVPVFFRNNDGRAAIFAGNVTAVYITNNSGATANVTIRSLENP